MKLYVANISQSEKMVYLSCIRNIKKDDKFSSIPFTLSVKKELFNSAFSGKKVTFPFIIDVHLEKGKEPVIKLWNEKV